MTENKSKRTSVSPLSVQQIFQKTKYQMVKSIGHGSFGEVFIGKNSSSEYVAIKVENKSINYRQLNHEYKVYQKLMGGEGIPNVLGFGSTIDCDYMIMDLLGPTLESLFNHCGRRFSVSTTFMIADQMLRLIEYVHHKQYLHRDIKPENFVVDRSQANKLFLIDFGLSKKYINDDGTHIAWQSNRSFIGTARYASINAQQRISQSRRDDLESIGYVLVYFMKGSLPWQNKRIVAKNPKQRKEMVLEMKTKTILSELCANLPQEIHFYLKYCRERIFDETPNYAYLRRLFGTALQRIYGPDYKCTFDWISKPDAGINRKATEPPETEIN